MRGRTLWPPLLQITLFSPLPSSPVTTALLEAAQGSLGTRRCPVWGNVSSPSCQRGLESGSRVKTASVQLQATLPAMLQPHVLHPCPSLPLCAQFLKATRHPCGWIDQAVPRFTSSGQARARKASCLDAAALAT